jgi:uncharacterized membrane protein YqjE
MTLERKVLIKSFPHREEKINNMGKKLLSELTKILLFIFVIVTLFSNINIVFAENYDWPTFHFDETRSGATKEALK